MEARLLITSVPRINHDCDSKDGDGHDGDDDGGGDDDDNDGDMMMMPASKYDTAAHGAPGLRRSTEEIVQRRAEDIT